MCPHFHICSWEGPLGLIMEASGIFLLGSEPSFHHPRALGLCAGCCLDLGFLLCKMRLVVVLHRAVVWTRAFILTNIYCAYCVPHRHRSVEDTAAHVLQQEQGHGSR